MRITITVNDSNVLDVIDQVQEWCIAEVRKNKKRCLRNGILAMAERNLAIAKGLIELPSEDSP